MLKIYLDWNSINNIQTRHPELYELIKEYGHLLIFPYSNAYIRDLMVSKDENNPFYQRDIATLTETCHLHFMATPSHLCHSGTSVMPLSVPIIEIPRRAYNQTSPSS